MSTTTTTAASTKVKDERGSPKPSENGSAPATPSHTSDISKRTAPASETPVWDKSARPRSSSPHSNIDPKLQSHSEALPPPPPRPASRSPEPEERDSRRRYEDDRRQQYEFHVPGHYSSRMGGSTRPEPYPTSRHRQYADGRPSPPPITTLPHSPSPSGGSGVSTPPIRRSPPPPPHHYQQYPEYRGMPAYDPRYGPPPPPPSGSYYGPPPSSQQMYNAPPPPRYEAYGGLPQPGPARDNYYVSGGTGAAASGVAITYTEDSATKLSDRVRRRCYNCCTTDTSTWRRSNLNPGKVLCNKCGLFERTHRRSRPDQFPHKRGPLASSNLRPPREQEMGPPGHVPGQYGPGPFEFHPPPGMAPYPGGEGHMLPMPPPPPGVQAHAQEMRHQSASPHQSNGNGNGPSAPPSNGGERERTSH